MLWLMAAIDPCSAPERKWDHQALALRSRIFTQFCRSSCLLMRQALIQLPLRRIKPAGQWGLNVPFVSPSAGWVRIQERALWWTADSHYTSAPQISPCWKVMAAVRRLQMLFWDFQHSKSDILISKKQVPTASKLMIVPSANKDQEKMGEKIRAWIFSSQLGWELC